MANPFLRRLTSARGGNLPVPRQSHRRPRFLTVARLAQRLLSSLEDYFAQLNPNL